MKLVDLDVSVRESTGSRASRKMRRYGKVPAVLYGLKKEPLALSVKLHSIHALLREGQRVVKLKMGDDDQRAIIREVQHDVLGDSIIHIDFSRIKMGQAIVVTVPIVLSGMAKGVMEGGVLEQKKDMVEIRAVPTVIPEHIDVDVKELALGTSLHLGEIELPEGLALAHEGDKTAILASISVKAGSADEDEGEEVEAERADGQPEIIGKSKEEGSD